MAWGRPAWQQKYLGRLAFGLRRNADVFLGLLRRGEPSEVFGVELEGVVGGEQAGEVVGLRGGEFHFESIACGVEGGVVWIILMTGAVLGLLRVLIHGLRPVLIIIKPLIFFRIYIPTLIST